AGPEVRPHDGPGRSPRSPCSRTSAQNPPDRQACGDGISSHSCLLLNLSAHARTLTVTSAACWFRVFEGVRTAMSDRRGMMVKLFERPAAMPTLVSVLVDHIGLRERLHDRLKPEPPGPSPVAMLPVHVGILLRVDSLVFENGIPV